jgi:hypothetical protein
VAERLTGPCVVHVLGERVPHFPQARRKPPRASLARPRSKYIGEDGDIVAAEDGGTGRIACVERVPDSLGGLDMLEPVEKRVSGSPRDREDSLRADDADAVEADWYGEVLP